MMTASLEDQSHRNPDFKAIFADAESDGTVVQKRRFKHYSRWIIPVAAAVLTAAIATPIGVFAGRISVEKQIRKDTTELFVDRLIGESLFEESLMMDESWFSEIEIDENFFEI